MKSLTVFLYTVFTAWLAGAQSPETHYWRVADTKMPCTHNNTFTSCLRIRMHHDSAWKDFPYEIEGFIFEPGSESLIEVMLKPIAFPVENGPRYTYHLVQVLESKNTVLTDKRLLFNNRWKIVNVNYNRKPVFPHKTGAYIEFLPDSNRISGYSGCNTFSAATLIGDGELTFGLLDAGSMPCAHAAVEKRVLEAMQGKAVFYIRNKVLYIVAENQGILHLRPERKLDSIMDILDGRLPAGNHYQLMPAGHYHVRIDSLPESAGSVMVFKSAVLTEAEQKTIRYKLISIETEGTVKAIHILKQPGSGDSEYAELILKDGTRRRFPIQLVR